MSSGGPPHHSHNRQVPNANAAAAAAWNHLQAQLQVPNYFPRQPQAAHTHPMPPSDHTMHPAHQHQAPPPSWHTPTTTDAMKMLPNIQHTHMLNEMLKQEGLFRGREGVDLSFSRNGNQNGELLTAPHPISLSVRDTNKINSLSGLDIQAVNSPAMKSTISPSLTITPSVTGSPGLKSVSPGLKSASPGMKSGSPGVKTGSPSHKSHSPAPKSGSPGLGPNLGGLLSMANLPNLPASALGIAAMEGGGKNQQKRSNIRVDSILERLNPVAEKSSQDHQAVGSGSFPLRPDLHAAPVNRAASAEVSKPSHEAAHQFAMARKQAEMLASLQGGLGPETLNPAAMANMQRFLEMAMSKNVIPDLSHVLRQDLAQLKHDAAPNTSNVTKNDSSNTSGIFPHIPVPSNLNIIDRTSNKDQILLDNRDKLNVDSRKPTAIEKDSGTANAQEKMGQQSGVIVQPAPSFDENSNSSSIANAPTPIKEDDSGSMHSNEDSLDSNKSRRKRKPSKTIKVLAKEDDVKDDKSEKLPSIEDPLSSQSSRLPINEPISVSSILSERTPEVVAPTLRIPERRRSSDDLDALISPSRTRRKTSSESETIDNIAAMVQQGLINKSSNKEKSKTGDVLAALRGVRKNSLKDQSQLPVPQPVPAPVSVIKAKEAVPEPLICSPLKPVLSARDEIDGPVKKDTDHLKREDTKKDQAEVVKEAAREPSRASPVMTPAQKKATNTHFVEVENKLEEMFGGILGEQPLTQPSGSTVNGESLVSDLLGHSDIDSSLTKFEENKEENNTEDKPKEEATTDSEKKEETKTNPKKGKRSRARSRQGPQNMEDGESGPKKGRFSRGKNSSKPQKPPKSPLPIITPASTATATSTSKSKSKVPLTTTSPSGSTSLKVNAKNAEPVKDVYAYDSGSNASSNKSRGPFVQIKGHRESPVSVSIVNTPFVDEDGDKKPLKSKKFHDDSEYRHKVRSKGLHCSTLSNKYDAQTKDATWICAFCKRGPHASELSGPSVISDSSASPQGDLFGPYFITTQCPEFERRLDDPYDKQFKSKKIGKALDGAAAFPGPSKLKNKSKRKHSESSLDPSDIHLGITSTGQDSYEVWAHEDCLIWSQGVYLVGPKIVGLEEAVWSSCNVSCVACHLKGANISCIKRGCLYMTHLCCARSNGWVFDDDHFKAYCPQHSLPLQSRKTGPEKKS